MTKKPQILVYIGADEPTRGDSHGFKGIGAQLADILQGDFHYVEAKTLASLYPEQEEGSERLARYFNDRAFPHIVFSTQATEVKRAMGRKRPRLFLWQYNEDLLERYLKDQPVVPHHLTPQLLAEEGKKFRSAYPDLPRPLIAVLFDHSISAIAESLVSKCAAYPEATLFLCGSWRTTDYDHALLEDTITSCLDQKGLTDKIKSIRYDVRSRKTDPGSYNPYIGLLNEADHVVVMSTSASLLSEPLAAGKPAIFTNKDGGTAEKLERRGLAHDFSRCARDARFETGRVTPINTARDVALKIAAKYKRTSWRRFLPWVHS